MKKILVAGIAAAACFGAPALAADMPLKAPIYREPLFNWTGFYVGGQVGGGWGDHDRLTVLGFANSYSSDGWLGGFHVGYNWQVNNVVFGVEGDGNFANISGDDGGVGGTLDRSTLDSVFSIRARLGIAANAWLFYVTGGWAFGSITHFNAGGAPAENSTDVSGWTAGAGIAWMFAPRYSAGIEYRWYDLGSYSLAPVGLTPFTVNSTYQTLMVRLSVMLP